jgi:hypothetical protein
MRRPPVALLLSIGLAAGALPALSQPAAAASPTPAPSAQSLPQGISVTPVPSSAHRSRSGSFLELGLVQFDRPSLDAVTVRSTFDHPQDVALHAADAQPATGGGFGFGGAADTPSQVGAWTRLASRSVRVPAGGQVEVPLTVTVPKGVSGGEYVGAVIAEPLHQGPASALQTRFRFAMAIYLRVPGGAAGATPGRGKPGGRLQVLSVAPHLVGSHACPVIRYRNDSQDIVDPHVTARTQGLFGSSYSRSRTGALLPGSSADVALPCLKRPLGPGRLQITLRSPDGGGSVAVDFTWWPAALLVALGFLLLLAAALLFLLIRGFRRRRADEDYAARSPV